LAARALEAGYRAFALEKQVERSIELLPSLKRLAKKAEMDGAYKPLQLAESAAREWHRNRQAIRTQVAEVVTGLVALAAGDTNRAEEHFRRANAVEELPSEPLVSFAEELVALGATDAVLAAVQDWERRFHDCTRVAGDWATAIRTGRNLGRPRFPPP
jgi:hypothetical protein